MKKLIKVYSYLQNNVGDDLMVELLINRYPAYHFWGCRGYQKKTKNLLNNPRYFDNEDIFIKWGHWNHLCRIITKKNDFLYKKIFDYLRKKCLCGIVIGGSIYREQKDEILEQRMAVENDKKVVNGPFFVIGANFGPYHSEEFYKAFYAYFSSCTGVSFRDKYSYSLFKKINTVQWAPDIVFTVPKGIIKDEGKVIISVINLEARAHLQQYSPSYSKTMTSLCSFWIDKGKTPVLTSFCGYEGDAIFVDKIYDSLTEYYKSKTERYYYDGDTQKILDLFRIAHFVIATRFHAMVLAMRFSKPLFTISYEQKMDNVLMDTGSTAFSPISRLIDYSPEQMYQEGKTPVKIDDYIQLAEKQFKQLDMYLANI